MNRSLMIHLLWMALGYALSVLVATAITVVCIGLPTMFPDQGEWGSFYRYMSDFSGMFAFGIFITAVYALPGWLVSVVIAELRNKRRKAYFAVTGTLTATFAIFISDIVNSFGSETVLVISCLTGGFFGGLAYWALVGKHSGDWKSPKKDTPA
ncbi:MAG: hypothetical protein ACRCU5_12110 [Rhizobiaceae bacterium]